MGADWDFEHRWRTWWVGPDGSAIPCDGFENGHWRLMCERPDLVTVPGPEGRGSFADFLASHDVEEDTEARDVMKFWVLSAGYVRCGLCQPELGYVDGIDARTMRKAVRFLARESGGMLDHVDLRAFSGDYSVYAVTDMSEEFVALEGRRISGFLGGAPLAEPGPAAPRGP